MTSRLALAVAVSLLWCAAPGHATATAEPRPKITVKKYTWKGYGFLPGYPRSERERQREKLATERRYIGWDGRVYYGFGGPGFYRGQYNGGSFGPCWTSTPIGLMWNCGR